MSLTKKTFYSESRSGIEFRKWKYVLGEKPL